MAKNVFDASYLATLVVSGTMFGMLRGSQGAAAGLCLAALDEQLISKNITTKHYLTSSALYGSVLYPFTQKIANAHPNYKLPIYGASAVLTALMSFIAPDFLNYQKRVNEPLSALVTVNKLFDNNQLIINFVFKNALQLLKSYISNYIVQYLANGADGDLIKTLILGEDKQTLDILCKKAVKISAILTLRYVIDTIFSNGQSYLENQIRKSVDVQSINKLLLNPENNRKILAIEDSDQIIQNLNGDLSILLNAGIIQLDVLSRGTIEQLNALQHIASRSPESIIMSVVTTIINSAQPFDSTYNSLMSESYALNAKKYNLIADLSSNLTNILLVRGDEYIRDKYAQIADMDGINNSKITYISNLSTIYSFVIEKMVKIAEVLYYGFKINNGDIEVERLTLLSSWLNDVTAFLNGNVGKFKAIKFTNFAFSKQRIDKLLEVISKNDKPSLVRSYNSDNKIAFQNYSLKLKDKLLVCFDKLELATGKHYVFTGDSGTGKTSIFKDIVGCITHPLSSAGEISLPLINGAKPTILFLSQEFHNAPEATLFELITMQCASKFDLQNKAIMDEKIIKLLKELNIDESAKNGQDEEGIIGALDKQDFALSGGQQRKVAIIRAVLAEPDILFLDEALVGLDPESLEITKRVLQDYLPTTTKFSIDHHAETNSIGGFYDVEIKLQGDCVIQQSFKSDDNIIDLS